MPQQVFLLRAKRSIMIGVRAGLAEKMAYFLAKIAPPE